MNRRLLLASIVAVAVAASPERVEAKGKSKPTRKRSARRRGGSLSPARGTTTGSCPCNGGRVCIGPRGGRYCITRGGNKRYGA